MPGIIAEEYSTWFYKTCYILTFAKQSALNMGIQGASLRFLTYIHFSCLFGILIGILTALLFKISEDS